MTLTIADNVAAQRIVEGVCTATRYDPASGKTKAEWVKDQIADFLKRQARQGLVQTDAATITTELKAVVVT